MTVPRFMDRVRRKGGRVLEVGGCVRDRLLGRSPKDTDYLVLGVPLEELVALLKPLGAVNLVGKSFGVIKFSSSDEIVDIALPRKEVSTGAGHRDFDVEAHHLIPLEEDLARRDFTLNAMAYDPLTGEILDPLGGREDLEARRLRRVGPRAFLEDPLRMLRAVQFAARFDLVIEEATLEDMAAQHHLISTVSPERIATELVKLVRAPRPATGFRTLQGTGILGAILPELTELVGLEQRRDYHCHDAFEHSLHALDAIPWAGREYLRLAALFHDLGKKATRTVDSDGVIHFYGHAEVSAELTEDILRRLKFTSVDGVEIPVDRVVHLVRHHMFGCTECHSDKVLRRFVRTVGKECVMDQIRLRIGDRLASARPDPDRWVHMARRVRALSSPGVPFTVKSLAIGGREVMAAGVEKGPQVGRVLQALLDRVVDEPDLNERERLLELLPEIIQRTGEAP